MRLWRNRPLFMATSVFMGAALTGFFLVPKAKCILAALCLSAMILLSILLLIRFKQRRNPVPRKLIFMLCLTAVATLALLQSLWAIDRAEARVQPYEGAACTVEATVTERKGSGSNMSSFVLNVTSINGEKVKYNAFLTCYFTADLRPGHSIILTAEATPLTEAAGDIYEEYHLMGEGIFGGFLSYEETDYEIVDETPDSLLLKLASHRYALSLDLERLLGDNAAGLPSALLLGERDHLSSETRRDFARTGVSHILAISGLHMTLLFGLLALILKLCRIPPRGRAVILGLLSLGYLVYLGFPPSATRAVVMLGMTYLASLCFAGADPLTSLGVAGMVILLVSPVTVADVGFWMSFSATFGLLSIQPLLNTPTTKDKSVIKAHIRKTLGGLCAGLAAMTFSLWITAPVMGEISLLSAPMTLLLTPLTGALLLLTPLSMLTAATPVGGIIVSITQGVSALMARLCEVCADPSRVVISLTHPAVPYIAACMVLLTLLFLGLSLRKKGMVLLPMAAGWLVIALLLGIQTASLSDKVQVSYLVPSTTSEMLVMTRGQEAVICELSNGSRRSFLTAANEASEQGATELSAVILTDYHSRTSGALLQLFRRETVRALWLPEPTSEEDYFLMLSCLEVAALTDTPAVIYRHGDELTLFGDAILTVERTQIKRSVQPVLLLTLETPCEQMVLCGRSILESDLALPALVAMAESDTVILSNKGPVIKEAMACTFGPNTKSLYVASKSVAAYLSPEHYPREDMLVTVGQGRFSVRLTRE
ncbi:MAG: ComEC/Rec2 family competence protein [Clostridia bacterium]|nr:ComEC/Rec2 family competence protein [Clostridia bacterium]